MIYINGVAKGAGITKLSELTIDVVKNWGAKRIENIGAPSTNDNVPRRDTIDSKITSHAGVSAAHHAKYTNAEAIAAAKTDTALKNPSGMIIMWHGLIANIPSGWVICDGLNSTPNLLAKFIESVPDVDTDPGATGGATSKSHASHYHTMPSHTHTMPTHSHGIDIWNRAAGTESGTLRHIYTDKTDSVDPGDTNSKDPGDTKSRTISAHSDIRPLFYDVAFIMKT